MARKEASSSSTATPIPATCWPAPGAVGSGSPRVLAPRPGAVGARAYDAFVACYNAGLLTRVTADIIAISPPLIAERKHIDEIFGILADVLKATA